MELIQAADLAGDHDCGMRSFEMGNAFEGTISRLPCAAVALLYTSTSSGVRLRMKKFVEEQKKEAAKKREEP